MLQDLGCGLPMETENLQQTQEDIPARIHGPFRRQNAPAELSGGTLQMDMKINRVHAHPPKNNHANGYKDMVWRLSC